MEGPDTLPSAGAVGAERRRRWPRWARFVLTVVIVGPVLTVLTAWGLAAWMPVPKSVQWTQASAPRREAMSVLPNQIVTLREQVGVSELDSTIIVFFARQHDELLRWSTLEQPSGVHIIPVSSTFAGWPWRALGATQPWFDSLPVQPAEVNVTDKLNAAQGSPTGESALRRAGLIVPTLWSSKPAGSNGVGWGVFARFRPKRAIPISPLWPGFGLNALAWGLVVGVVAFEPGALRRWLRRGRGRCEGCGYELAGLERCPECGELATTVGRSGEPSASPAG